MPDEQKMSAYIGAKIICAVPEDRKDSVDGSPVPGYRVVYPDGYESWSPKATFEAAYRLVSDEERKLV